MPLIRRGPPANPPASSTPVTPPGLLETGSTSERWAAARALGQVASAAQSLARALRTEKASEVRQAIFTSFVLIRTREAAEALASFIGSDDAELRTGALDALGAMMDVARPLLPALLNDADPDVRLLACELVRPLDPTDGTALLCRMLETEQQPNVCGAAVDVLSEIGLVSAVAALRQSAERFAGDAYLGFAIADAIARTSKRPVSNG
ncbi:MAG: HEAT repeat domain-containing protein [Burkholderiales bacterium]|nr:MAG: HEAT repeat domain-containing protein [Burkholderiales bacterium]